ncbi:MAG: hypothetical protein LBI96_03920 [Odoribacteraceae bacterium]|jgi:hypothetical protein|nr:hypothetical protein [Odoribacteraceae bacterium]
MKTLKHVIIAVIAFTCCTSCIQDYLNDGGVHDPNVNMTPYDFLASHAYHSFDTIVQIIDYYGLKDEMNEAATVFIPTDFSVRALLDRRTANLRSTYNDEGLEYSLDSLKLKMTADSVRIYFFHDKIELATAPLVPTEYLSFSGDGSGYAVYRAESTNSADWTLPSRIVTMSLMTKPYFLYMRKIVGQGIDPVGGSTPVPVDEQDITARCQTTGIICTPTGTVLHVLENGHAFSAFIVRTL